MPWKKKYRDRKSPRLKGWDYGQTAAYFITICTKNRESFLGEICDGIMGLSHMGVIANWFWLQIPHQFPHVELDEFIVMPNHVHGILTIYDQRNTNNRDAINRVSGTNRTKKKDCVPIDGDSIDNPIKQPGGATGHRNPMLSEGNLGKVIRWYKGRCAFEIRERGYCHFQWQGRYWDHVIEDEDSLTGIRQYIYNNPMQWKSDQLYGVE